MKHLIKITIIAILAVSFTSCNKKSRPNYQYMPNMYESVGYEAYQESDAFANGQEAQLPVEGTISRGYTSFDYTNDVEGYDLAKAELKSPLDSTQFDEPRAKELYTIYCGICHGNKGAGQGKLVKREKILGVPSYDDAGRAINEGSIYHVIYYGKNSMGSYANFLSEEERWQVVSYVMKLKADLEK
ncbi:c-type cytochrome [Olleya aquimaris]|uniref:Cbb3-type cytochrome c oxidase subunit III n=1 Tax=Olleya aquimaris TaxID=639310 RepID=A0A327RQ98_9FLAO|nr:cytochrome c [Olleya aquimaris]RAJ18208.1 cbb3-type cytochrome c oxidase subunit III [Olleya aquimaris]